MLTKSNLLVIDYGLYAVSGQGLKDSDPGEIPFRVCVAEFHEAPAAGSTPRFRQASELKKISISSHG